ncbi:MAG: hypothetical protein JWQ09_3225 [Segetibacter sp.]|nr:hypothetical protein [Segetibacter sp.]
METIFLSLLAPYVFKDVTHLCQAHLDAVNEYLYN